MIINCDGKIYNPLGASSYVFEKEIIPYLLDRIKKSNLKISIGIQPNSSPHFGTLTVFVMAFELAKRLNAKNASILFEVVDTAPSETIMLDDMTYQKSLRTSGIVNIYMKQCLEILEYLKSETNIEYEVRFQNEFNHQKEIFPNMQKILDNKDMVAKILDPKYNNLRIRIACPNCGLSDKNSVKNEYAGTIIISYCPIHGKFETDISRDTSKLEYNTPLRNLIRGMVYGDINNNENISYEIMRITGSDYSGFYQEELLYKMASALGYQVHNLPIIFYTPLIMDWSGAKLSKSLYVEKGAYSDLPKEFINFENLKKKYNIKGLSILHDIIKKWIDNPYMLFRHYSIYYFIKEFENHEETGNLP